MLRCGLNSDPTKIQSDPYACNIRATSCATVLWDTYRFRAICINFVRYVWESRIDCLKISRRFCTIRSSKDPMQIACTSCTDCLQSTWGFEALLFKEISDCFKVKWKKRFEIVRLCERKQMPRGLGFERFKICECEIPVVIFAILLSESFSLFCSHDVSFQAESRKSYDCYFLNFVITRSVLQQTGIRA